MNHLAPHLSVRHTLRSAVAAAALVAWLTTGCATYHVYQIKGPLEMGNQPLTEWKGKTLHSLVWGAIRQDMPVDNCRLGDGTRTGIEEVRVRSNVGATAAAILTLGFWRPLQVTWRCAKPPGLRGVVEPPQ
ncbi:MAG: hypothetical protein HOP28_02755 [Gemmatimonadales bacterium]|nr:hypothetical protein [Gemmatimonadales bacterium]